MHRLSRNPMTPMPSRFKKMAELSAKDTTKAMNGVLAARIRVPAILKEVEIQASDASAAIVAAATITLPPRTIGLRILDREGREVLVDRRPTADRAMDRARSSPRGRNRRARQLRRRAILCVSVVACASEVIDARFAC